MPKSTKGTSKRTRNYGNGKTKKNTWSEFYSEQAALLKEIEPDSIKRLEKIQDLWKERKEPPQRKKNEWVEFVSEQTAILKEIEPDAKRRMDTIKGLWKIEKGKSEPETSNLASHAKKDFFAENMKALKSAQPNLTAQERAAAVAVLWKEKDEEVGAAST